MRLEGSKETLNNQWVLNSKREKWVRVSNSDPKYMPNIIKDVYEKKCTWMFKATLFPISKKWNYLKSPSTERQKLDRSMQTDYNSALKRALSSDRDCNMDHCEKHFEWKKQTKITTWGMILFLGNVYMKSTKKVAEEAELVPFFVLYIQLISVKFTLYVLGIQWIFNANLLSDYSYEAVYKTMENSKA